MQITIKSMRVIKEGDRGEGDKKTHWKWCSVMADDGSEKGTEYTTFDASVLSLGPGSVIDIGDIETQEGKLKFKKVVSVISEVKATAPVTAPGPARETSPEEWAEKQRIERASFEGQTVFKEMMETARAYIALGISPYGHDEFKDDFALAMDYARKRLNPNLGEAVASMPHLGRTESGNTHQTFKNVGEFLTAMLEKGFSRKQVIDELIRLKLIKAEADLPRLDLEVAWETLKDVIIDE